MPEAINPKFNTNEQILNHCRRIATLKPGDTFFLKSKEGVVVECVFLNLGERGKVTALTVDRVAEGEIDCVTCFTHSIYLDHPAN